MDVRRHFPARALCAAALLIFTIVPIAGRPADAPDPAFEPIKAAAAGVTSFRVTTTVRFSGTSITVVSIVQSDPYRRHGQTDNGRGMSGTYYADGFMYSESVPGRWFKMPIAPSPNNNDLTRFLSDIESANVRHDPDIVDGSKHYAVFVITAATPSGAGQPPGTPLVTTCTVDKATWLPHTCQSTIQTETFDRFNDPGNVVVVPPAALAAPTSAPLPPPPPGH